MTQVLALGLGILLNRVGSTFIEVWKRFQEEGLHFCQGWSLTRGLKIISSGLPGPMGLSNAFWELPMGDRTQADRSFLEKSFLEGKNES